MLLISTIWRHEFRGLVLTGLIGLLLLGCGSIPLSTMLRMSGFDEQDFAAIDPEQLRVRIALPDGFKLDTAASEIRLELNSTAGVNRSAYRLEAVSSQPVSLTGGWFRSQPGHADTLRLAPSSVVPFRELQALVGNGKTETVDIEVRPRIARKPDDAASVSVWIELQLSEADGYFRLLEGAELPLAKKSPAE